MPFRKEEKRWPFWSGRRISTGKNGFGGGRGESADPTRPPSAGSTLGSPHAGGERPAASLEMQIWGFLISRQEAIAKALPKHKTADRMAMVAFSEIRKNPKLLSCFPQSLVASVITASQLGLEPGPLGHCYLVPYWNDKAKSYDLQLQIGYRGMLALDRRSGEISDLYGQIVYANDAVEVEYGLDRKLIHRPAEDGERGDHKGAYVLAKFKDGGCFFDYMTWQEALRRRDTYSKGAYDRSGNLQGPWKDEPEEMGLKTVLRHAWKWLPMSVEMRRMVEESDGAVKVEVAPDMAQVTDIAREEIPAIEEAPSTMPQEASGSREQVSLDLEGKEGA